MNEDVKNLWVAALRSGKYQQATKQLCSIDPAGNKSYCCLGVLCELALEQGVDVEYEARGPIGYYSRAWETLPKEVQAWAGMKDEAGEYPKHAGSPYQALAELNDDAGYTFEQLADFIEKNGEQL